jgi:hypothetical protein
MVNFILFTKDLQSNKPVTPLPKSLLLHTERKVLINVGNTGVRHLAQEVVQLGCHSKVAVTDFLAKVPQIDQQTEGVGFVGSRLSQGRLRDGPRQTQRMAAQAR